MRLRQGVAGGAGGGLRLLCVSPRARFGEEGVFEQHFPIQSEVSGTHEFVLSFTPRAGRGSTGRVHLPISVDVPRGGGVVELGTLEMPATDRPGAGEGIVVRAATPENARGMVRLELHEPTATGADTGSWRSLAGKQVPLGPDGRAVVRRPAPAEVLQLRVLVAGPPLGATLMLSRNSSEEVSSVLSAKSRLLGRVIDPEGVRLVARPAEFGENAWSHQVPLRPGDGAFRLALPAGRWELALLSEYGRTELARYNNLDLPAGGDCQDPRLEELRCR